MSSPSYSFSLKDVKGPEKTFFFERPNGTTFACSTEEEASIIYQQKWFKFVGQSDGVQFYNALKELATRTPAIEEAQRVIREAEKAELEIARLNKTPPRNVDRKMGFSRNVV